MCAPKILSKGYSDPSNPHIVAQTAAKLPTRKEPIADLYNAQFGNPQATIKFNELQKAISSLKPRVAPGPGDLRNEHLIVLLHNE